MLPLTSISWVVLEASYLIVDKRLFLRDCLLHERGLEVQVVRSVNSIVTFLASSVFTVLLQTSNHRQPLNHNLRYTTREGFYLYELSFQITVEGSKVDGDGL